MASGDIHHLRLGVAVAKASGATDFAGAAKLTPVTLKRTTPEKIRPCPFQGAVEKWVSVTILNE
jgi:hypothetical protein